MFFKDKLIFTAENVRYVKVEFTKIETAQGHTPDQLKADITELEVYQDLGVASVDEFNLKGLDVAGNDLVLDPAVTEYNVNLAGTEKKLYIRALTTDPNAAVSIGGTAVSGLNGKTDLNGAVAVVAVYNANGMYMDAIHMDIALKADVNGNKKVDVDDFGLIKAKFV